MCSRYVLEKYLVDSHHAKSVVLSSNERKKNWIYKFVINRSTVQIRAGAPFLFITKLLTSNIH